MAVVRRSIFVNKTKLYWTWIGALLGIFIGIGLFALSNAVVYILVDVFGVYGAEGAKILYGLVSVICIPLFILVGMYMGIWIATHQLVRYEQSK